MKVLYYAELKEILGTDSENIDLSYDITVKDFITNLFKKHPSIQEKQFQIAVNEEFVQSDDVVRPNDIVALIPPVSGG
ncbi:molybdopterin converting factor subunit 1 [Staphylococcus sp. Marseille-Q5304]|uniref:molybdopterin converting factor subunit 1 n=1 Tax=Staphylococcus sp. Marseille-Q5304 TaxID=2942200 RepID=UPI00207479DD|nr:molybdopterin converting factor subunit 1 [Staphylococcus sp. Marseille-Q5304]